LRIGRDDAHQGRVRNVDGRVHHHHQAESDIGVDQLSIGAESGRGEGERADDAERESEPQQIGAELAPASAGSVAHHAHKQVEAHVKDARKKEQSGELFQQRAFQRGIGCVEKDVGIKLALKVDKGHPKQIGGRITEGVAGFFKESQLLRLHTHGFVPFFLVALLTIYKLQWRSGAR
jgi:hypothetical protein